MFCDISNLDLIYHPDSFTYSLPRSVLETFISGKAFDHKEEYTAEEKEKLWQDIFKIYQEVLTPNPPQELVAHMTAGAPGVGKTRLLEQDRKKEGRQIAYIDPDAVCLIQQEKTYQAELDQELAKLESEGNRTEETEKQYRKAAYDKWRPGSNAANHVILANLIREKYAFYFGTTCSAPQTAFFFKFLKDQGYQIRLLHLTAPDNVRWRSIQERDKTFVQTTEEDTRKKGELVPQRIHDTFLKFADKIEFYYRAGVKENAVLAATWVRNEQGAEKLG
jgi:predicted ABC-type ATPase